MWQALRTIGWGRWSGRAALAVVAALIMLVSGCGASPETTDSLGTTDLDNGLLVPRTSGGPPGVGDAARLAGTVIDHGGCLAFRHDEPHEDYVTIAVFDVLDSRPERLRVGQHIALGGGWMPPQENFEIPEACAGQEDYFLVVMD